MKPLRFFITGTDTNVGKTEAGCALLSLMADASLSPFAYKPYESGCAHLAQPADGCALRRAAHSGDPLEWTSLYRFKAPLAPGVAAALERRATSFRTAVRGLARFGQRPGIVEGAGGLHVPLDAKHDVIDLIRAMRLPTLLVARAGLGTLNHVALSLDALAASRIEVAAVLLVCGSATRDVSVATNPVWIQRRHGVHVLGPVPYRTSARERKNAFRRVLAPLLDPLTR